MRPAAMRRGFRDGVRQDARVEHGENAVMQRPLGAGRTPLGGSSSLYAGSEQ